MNYFLAHKDQHLGVFDLKHKQVTTVLLVKSLSSYLPLPLQRITNNIEEFVELEDDGIYYLNDEGCTLMEMWLSDRQVPARKDNQAPDSFQWMMNNYALSFTDCYWVYPESQQLLWDDVKLYNYKSIDKLTVVLQDQQRMYRNYNATLGGMLSKFWYSSNNTLKLCKKTEPQWDILNAREVIASMIYECQRYDNACHYDFVYNTQHEIVGCKCKAFTSENRELLTAYDLLEQYNLTQVTDIYEQLINIASNLGADRQTVSDFLDIQMIVDYLIGNRDRHQNNIGFLRDSNTLKVIGPAPIYDSGSDKQLENEYPINKINGLYSTFEECLNHVTNWDIIDIEKLPNKEALKTVYDQCLYLPAHKKIEYVDRYQERVEHISNLKLQHIVS